MCAHTNTYDFYNIDESRFCSGRCETCFEIFNMSSLDLFWNETSSGNSTLDIYIMNEGKINREKYQ